MKKWPILIGVSIVVLAVFFRFFNLGEVPVSLYWDEIAILVDAKAVAQTGLDMHGNSMWQAIFPSYGDYKLPVYIWLASLSVKIFGVSEWAVRLPSVLAGLGTILLTACLVKKLFVGFEEKAKTNLALWIAMVIAISPWSIMFSRTAFEGHLAQFFVVLSIWLLLKKQKWGEWSMLAALFGGLATYTYFSVRFIWPVLFTVITLLFVIDWSKKFNFKNYFAPTIFYLILPLLIYFFSLQPMYNSPLYEVSNQFRLSTTSVLNMRDWPVVSNEYKLLAGNTLLDKITYHPFILIARELAKNFADNMSVDFLFLTGDTNLRHGTGRHGLFLWIFLPSFIYGWYKLFPKFWKQGMVLLVWWLAALLPASVPESTPHALRSLNALAPLSIIIGWGSYWLFTDLNNLKIWQNRYLEKLQLVINFGLLLIASAVLFNFASYLFNVYPGKAASSWQAGYKEVAQIIAKERVGKDTVWVEPFDSRFHLWLLGYELPVVEFKDIEFNNYIPDKIDNIAFRPFDWAKVKTMEPKTIVAGKKVDIDKQLSLSPIQPTWYKTITTADGETPFVVIYFDADQKVELKK